jgi:sugar lactone lactonase YvrE
MSSKPEVLLSGLRFPEGPRWRDGKLWFSDMHACEVRSVDLDGRSEVVVRVANEPSGLGWLPDGRLLVVSMQDRRLLRVDDGELTVVADLSPLAPFHCNDMVVDTQGRAYVGNFGSDVLAGEKLKPTCLILVHPDGRTRVVAEDLWFPNGTVITPDGRTLVVGESYAARLSAFDVAEDGGLSNRREWAKIEGALPDGCCLDAEGAIWVASPISGEVVRVREGGEVTQRITVETQAIACMLGGPVRRTLFILTSAHIEHEKTQERTGRIEMVEVDVPGAGLP